MFLMGFGNTLAFSLDDLFMISTATYYDHMDQLDSSNWDIHNLNGKFH